MATRLPDALTVRYAALLRQKRGLTHRGAAELLGATESVICRWLASGPPHRNPSPGYAAAMRSIIATVEGER
jgi:predicted transcriptional regulator